MQDNKEYKKRIKNINRAIVLFVSVWLFMLLSFYPYFEETEWLLHKIIIFFGYGLLYMWGHFSVFLFF